jgi:hypothetical protein
MASADLSIRTVVGQSVHDVADQLRAWVDERVGDRFGHELTISPQTAQEAYRTPEIPALDALVGAMAKGFRVEADAVGHGQRRRWSGRPPGDGARRADPVLRHRAGRGQLARQRRERALRRPHGGAATMARLWAALGATTPAAALGATAGAATEG